MEAFSPKSEEFYQLSVDSEEIFTGRQSYEFRTGVLGRKSLGVWTVPNSEFISLGISIQVDKVDGNPSHSLAQFPPKDRAKRKDAARRLAVVANGSSFALLKINGK
jgi:hypothetical protein